MRASAIIAMLSIFMYKYFILYNFTIIFFCLKTGRVAGS